MLLKILGWLNLLDIEGKLSITNAAVIALVIKMLTAPNLDWPAVTGMLVVFANYMHKRQATNGSVAADETEQMKAIKIQYEAAVVAQAKAIADIQAKLGSVSQLTDMMRMTKKV